MSFRLFLLNKDWGYPPRQKQNYSQIQITNVIKKVNEIAVINDLLLSDKLIEWNEDNNTFRVSLRITYTSLPSDNDKGVDGLLSLANFEDTGAVVGKTYSCLINFDSLLTDKHDERTQKKALDELVKKFKGKKARFSTFEFRISELSGGKGESINDGTHTYSSLANTYLGKVDDEDAEFNKLKERMNDMLDDDFEFGEAGQNQKVEKPIEEVLSTEATEEDFKYAIEVDYGVKYSRDGKKLLKASSSFWAKKYKEYVVREGTEIICDGALKLAGIRSVKLPSTIISIGSEAFASNTFLDSCNIPASVKYIAHSNPWRECFHIMNMDIQSKNFIIKDGILYSSDFRIVYGAIYWKSVFNIDNRSKKICANAFLSNRFNKNKLKSIGLSNIEYIGIAAFSGCGSLQSVTIPNSVTSIGDRAFSSCKSLQSVTIPNSVTSIGDRVFIRCKSLQSVTIPNSVTSIGDRAFYLCESLQSVTIPNSVTSIGDEAFSSCTSHQSVTIPNSVTSIGYEAFSRCTSLQCVTIPNSVTSIGYEAFSGCNSLQSVTIPNSVTSIGDYAFCSCYSLQSVTIPNSVTKIGDFAFVGCESLQSITIPNSVKSIGNDAFRWCKSLQSVTIPNSVTKIGDYAFSGCTHLDEPSRLRLKELNYTDI
mgnify:CR=1 FL=1